MATLLPNSSWYKGGTTYPRTSITEINIVTSHTPASGAVSWDASVEQNGSIMCYVEDTVLYIVCASTLYANADSSYMFSDSSETSSDHFSNITTINGLSLINTQNATTLKYCFWGCAALTSLDLSSWNVSNVEVMTGMFWNCSVLSSLNMSNWNTSKVQSFDYMFYSCKKLANINVGHFNTSNAKTLQGMFFTTPIVTVDIGNWDTANVENMFGIFYNCQKLESVDVSKWKTNKVTTMQGIFYGCIALTNVDVSKWNTANVEGLGMSNLFMHCRKINNLDLKNWNTSKVTSFASMFLDCRALTEIDVSNFDSSNVQFFDQMFDRCFALETIIGLEKFNTSNGLGFQEMFYECESLKKLDLSSFDTRKATTGVAIPTIGGTTTGCQYMFSATIKLEEIKLGENFRWNGDGTNAIRATLENRGESLGGIPGATGTWYTFGGHAYQYNAMPDGAGTYYASRSLIDDIQLLVKNSTLIDIATAIKTKSGITGDVKLTELPDTVENIETGGTELPTLNNEGVASDLMSGKELIDDEGNVVTGTFTIDNELNSQNGLINQIQNALIGKSSGNNATNTCHPYCAILINNYLPTITQAKDFSISINDNTITITYTGNEYNAFYFTELLSYNTYEFNDLVEGIDYDFVDGDEMTYFTLELYTSDGIAINVAVE